MSTKLTLSPWRKKREGNIGHAIEAQVFPPTDKTIGGASYHDNGYRIVCSYMGREDNIAGLSEDEHAEALGSLIVRAVNSHDALVSALQIIASRADGYTHGDKRVEMAFSGIAELALVALAAEKEEAA